VPISLTMQPSYNLPKMHTCLLHAPPLVASMRPSLKIGDSGCKRPPLRREGAYGVVKLDMDSSYNE